ncbi:DNA ligase [Thalassotalea piscium]
MKRFKYLTLIILIFAYSFNVFATQLPIQHGVDFKEGIEVKDYWISEKLDGVRGYWDGNTLLTRQGNKIYPPKGFTDNWPKIPLDGELWSSRGNFQKIVSCVRKKTPDTSCWQKIKFMVFDLPNGQGDFTRRLTELKTLLAQSPSNTIAIIEQFELANETLLFSKLDDIVAMGGEGLMLHHKKALYKSGRNNALLKLKPYQDDEAIVLKHIAGKGKYKGMLGSLLVKNKEGVEFKIGTGFTDQDRQSPPPIGSEITYKFIGKTDRGVPRFASFLRIKQ